jgi:aminoglycoside 3-N-acetyltransferase
MTGLWDDEKQVVESTEEPITKRKLVQDLQKAGIRPGDIVLVHSSMRSIGWIVGGAVTVIAALRDAVTSEGTVVMPTQSTDNGEPSQWQNPAVPEEWWNTIREEMPPYDAEITPTRKMGIIAETFRKYPGVYRSPHPQASFAARGRQAKYIVESHPVDDVFGEKSPLGRLYELGAKILLIGIGLNANTSLHHAEFRAKIPNMPREYSGAAVLENGKRVWKTWEQIEYNDDDFPQIAAAFEDETNRTPIYIGQAESHLFPMRELIDFGVSWLKMNRVYE